MAKLTDPEARRLMGSAYGCGNIMDDVIKLAEQMKDEGKLEEWFEERDRLREQYASRQDALAEGEHALSHHNGAHKDVLYQNCPLCAPRIVKPELPLKVLVLQKTILLDPPVDVWNIVIDRAGGEWRETFGSSLHRDAFLRGLVVASSLFGRPEPVVTNSKLVDREQDEDDDGD